MAGWYYHSKCVKINLLHLFFSDNLMIFSETSRDSLLGIKQVLDKIQHMARLGISDM